MKEVKILGIDLAKDSFSVCALSEDGTIAFRKTLNRKELIELTANFKPCLIGIEACGGSHYWGRLFAKQGHTVKMMSVYSVKAFCPANKKNDTVDAQAIAVAANQATVRSVRVKEVANQDLDVLKNLRDQFLKQRVALVNQAHAVCLEYGVSLQKSRALSSLKKMLEAIEDATTELTSVAREVVWKLLDEAKALNEKAEELEKKLEALLQTEEKFKLLKSIPGVGTLTAATVLSHTGGSVENFKNGRQFAAYLGLVPRQYSTGGKTSLRGITKTGQSDLRRLLVIGARTVMIRSGAKKDKVNIWINEKKKSKGFMKANIALANKTARIIYAVLKNHENYRLV